MGILNEARREFIAAPDSSKGQIVYKWPDQNIRKFARAIVEPDAVAVFMSQGQIMGVLLGGQHMLDAKELPFLGMFVDWASAGNAFKAELYFVGIRDFPSFRFGGRLDEVQDPVSGLIVTLRTFGEYALRVIDAPKLILNLVGTVDVTSNDAITGWVAQQLLKVTRTTVTTQLMSGAWPILGLSMHSPEIEVAAMQAANHELADYGLSITRLGNLDINGAIRATAGICTDPLKAESILRHLLAVRCIGQARAASSIKGPSTIRNASASAVKAAINV